MAKNRVYQDDPELFGIISGGSLIFVLALLSVFVFVGTLDVSPLVAVGAGLGLFLVMDVSIVMSAEAYKPKLDENETPVSQCAIEYL